MIGILGGGQLARMLALAATPLGLRVRTLDPNADSPAGHCAELVVAPYDDPAGLARLAAGCTAVTYEFENVPAAAVERLAGLGIAVRPAAGALAISQDRIPEKDCFNACGLPTAPYRAVDSRADLEAAVAAIGLPGVLKTRRFGYDGKGQKVLRRAEDLDAAWAELGRSPLIYEGFVPFDSECSLIAVRGADGATACYPLVENHHRDGILRLSICPGRGTAGLQAEAEAAAGRLLARLDYVGVLAVEFFRVGGRLLGNEMAPRVHNSGHWSIEGAECSQFENHMRAVAGLPLGSTWVRGAAAMVNLIGDFPDLRAVLAEPGVHLHHYGKEPRPGRKIGHLTVVADDHAALVARLRRLAAVTGLDLPGLDG